MGHSKHRFFSLWVAVGILFAGSCTPTHEQSPKKAPSITTVKRVSSVNVVSIKAPEAVLDLLQKWRGRYVFFAHEKANIRTIEDFNTRELYCAAINVKVGRIMDDAFDFITASGVDIRWALQNNPDYVADQLLEKIDSIGFMIPEVAVYYGFPQNENLVEIRFE